MNLAEDLLAQARYLARHEPRRPKQATLRRAVSAAYYAVFHLLTDASAHLLISGDGMGGLRDNVQRAYDHGTMKTASRSFSGGKLPRQINLLLSGGVPSDIVFVAAAFHNLQEARHEADYDVGRRYSRDEVRGVVSLTEQTFTAWKRVRAQPESKIFLVSLLLWKQWNR